MIHKITILTLLIFHLNTSAQEAKKEIKTIETKMDVFASKAGTITRFTDSELPSLKLSYGGIAETRIRKISSGTINGYFYQISKEGKYNTATASIEYADLLEIIKALKTLKSTVDGDIAANPDYMENKFTTVDGFQVGYYVKKGKSTWYLKLEKYGSDATAFVEDADAIETAFNDAKSKIEELKSKS